MAYQLITAPAVEPLLLAEVKTHLREDLVDTANDALITLLLAAARQYAEQLTGRSFITQTWRYVFDCFPGGSGMFFDWPWGRGDYSHAGNAILLEKSPIQSIDSIQYLDMTGTLQTVPTSLYVADLSGQLARITPRFGQIWPIALPQIAACQVNFTAGYGAAATNVPEGLRQWLKLRIGALYQNREEFVSGQRITITPLPFVDGLLDAYRIVSA